MKRLACWMFRHASLWGLFAAAIVIPVSLYFAMPHIPALNTLPPSLARGAKFAPSPLRFRRESISPDDRYPQWYSNVQISDLDGDGINDVVACDARRNSVVWFRRTPDGGWKARALLERVNAPAHATIVDLDRDGDLDLVVAVLGNIFPDDDVIGKVIWLENRELEFRPHVLLDDVRRVADVQPGDFDADGDLDLAVAVFGYARGQVLWLENVGETRFREHELLAAPGTIHVPVADYDGDGDLDIAAIVSQEEEELWAFENLGEGRFQRRRLYFTTNYDLGSAGLLQSDLDGDGDVDLILPAGDNLEDEFIYPQPYHGCLWFENRGGWEFEPHQLAHFGGTYAAAVSDLDSDGDQDVVLVSMIHDRNDEDSATIVWCENDGRQNFRTWQIDSRPSHLIALDCGDLNGDGQVDIVAGGLHLHPPYDRLGGVTVWHQQQGSTRPAENGGRPD